jgi:hypothetical protein
MGLLLDQLDVAVGEQALHPGCGTGYYTAVVAELVGRERSPRSRSIPTPLRRPRLTAERETGEVSFWHR